MKLEFHPQVASDISLIMDYYEDASGQQLVDEFFSELRSCFQKAADSPEAYDIRERDLRRVNLENFPYHFLFRIVSDHVRILVSSPPEATVVRPSPAMNSANFFGCLAKLRSTSCRNKLCASASLPCSHWP